MRNLIRKVPLWALDEEHGHTYTMQPQAWKHGNIRSMHRVEVEHRLHRRECNMEGEDRKVIRRTGRCFFSDYGINFLLQKIHMQHSLHVLVIFSNDVLQHFHVVG